ncbi:hypothetical protein H0H81_005601 [Sphagnurus paluster]|uniref:Uncharacterized protein n=1 Tax=Sphagnurus paluster TaxID=117069 RepID=A0A9P7FRE9_9AGAR|nr:hypothetical protein H0H81_005601 [Sphagnurus paluster]
MYLAEYVDLLNTLQRVMHSVLSTKIMLHVRATARSRYLRDLSRREQSTADPGTFSTILQFTDYDYTMTEGEISSRNPS